MGNPPGRLDGVLLALEQLVAQARMYERALPADNYPARAAVAALERLARQALNEARDAEAGSAMDTGPEDQTRPAFSPREREVLCLAAQGLTNKEIAYRLGISERTVQFHMNSIFNRTGTQSRTEVVALALKKGWIAG